MNVIEALVQLYDQKPVRLKSFPEGEFIHLDEELGYVCYPDGQPFDFSIYFLQGFLIDDYFQLYSNVNTTSLDNE